MQDDPGIRNAIERLGYTPSRWLLVDVARQRLLLLHGDEVSARWPMSTAAAGVDARQDSGGTPPGLHRIARKIGDGADPGAVFVSRQPTGEVWDGRPDPRDLILGRILTLEGCEDGINRGPGVDSLERYIYLHGTNHEDRLGQPCSHGCVRLGRADMVAVFEAVQESDPVVVV
jgi:UDP-N-acetylmuramate--alanine ligase